MTATQITKRIAAEIGRHRQRRNVCFKAIMVCLIVQSPSRILQARTIHGKDNVPDTLFLNIVAAKEHVKILPALTGIVNDRFPDKKKMPRSGGQARQGIDGPQGNQAGIPDHCRFHDIRHTFASRLVEKGYDLATVKELMGHKDIKMTLRYSHISDEHKRNAVEALVETGAEVGTQTARKPLRVAEGGA